MRKNRTSEEVRVSGVSRQRLWQRDQTKAGRCQICAKPSPGRGRCYKCEPISKDPRDRHKNAILYLTRQINKHQKWINKFNERIAGLADPSSLPANLLRAQIAGHESKIEMHRIRQLELETDRDDYVEYVSRMHELRTQAH